MFYCSRLFACGDGVLARVVAPYAWSVLPIESAKSSPTNVLFSFLHSC